MDTNKKPLSELLIPLIITSVITISGWGFISYLNSERDKENKLREIKLTYLIDAYKKLAYSSQRTTNMQHFQFDMESAISDIQLFGSDEQIQKVNVALDQLKKDNRGLRVDEILTDLRNSLRQEINLSPIDSNVKWVRFNEVGIDSINKVLNNKLPLK